MEDDIMIPKYHSETEGNSNLESETGVTDGKDMKTILILDDEDIVRNSFIDYFEDHSWRTVSAESGEEALKLITENSPDVAIVDIRLPGMDGDEFIRRAHHQNSTMVFVIYTGSPGYDISEDLRGLPNVSRFLFKKPVASMDHLKEEILRMIDTVGKE